MRMQLKKDSGLITLVAREGAVTVVAIAEYCGIPKSGKSACPTPNTPIAETDSISSPLKCSQTQLV
jgi:hypothetical protein